MRRLTVFLVLVLVACVPVEIRREYEDRFAEVEERQGGLETERQKLEYDLTTGVLTAMEFASRMAGIEERQGVLEARQKRITAEYAEKKAEYWNEGVASTASIVEIAAPTVTSILGSFFPFIAFLGPLLGRLAGSVKSIALSKRTDQ
jgi:hypothetical protein